MGRFRWVGQVLAAASLLALVTAGCAGGAARPAGTQSRAPRSVSAAQCARNRAAGTVTFVSPFSFDASAGILDVFAAQSLGYFRDLCVKVQFVTNSQTVNQLVSSGQGTITGEGSAADALVAMASGSKFVGILTFANTSNYAIITRQSVPSLKDLEGKVLGYHYVLPVVLTEMLKAAHVDLSKVKEVNDTGYDPTVVVNGPYDGLQAYQSNEPLTLAAAHLRFHEFIPSRFGVSGTFNVQVVNRAFLLAHRSTVADFLRAELHAYDYCRTHQARCVGIEQADAKAAGVPYAVAHEKAEWAFETTLVATHTLPGKGVGVETTAEWAPERHDVVAAGLVKAGAIPSWAEDPALAASLYHGKQLIWP